MAVIDDIAGLEVEIIVDGEALREYDNVDALEDDHKTVVRYVVAEPGKEFAVRMRSTNAFELGWPLWDLCARLYVDDNSKLPPNDEKDIKKAKAMGEISLTICRGTKAEVITAPSQPVKFKSVGKVHEKMLKGRAMSRQAGLGKASEIAAPVYMAFEYHDTTPCAEFKFRYRSYDDLKAEMIIARSESPVPLEDRPRESLSREELLVLLAREEAANRETKSQLRMRVKRERATQGAEDEEDDDDEDGVEVVTPPPKRQKVIESIDLTDD